MEDALNPEERFSDRVESYIGGRPGYPHAALVWLFEAFDLFPPAMIADVGAGPGISAALMLRHGFDVLAVEPNDAMRDASVRMLGPDPQFHAIAGSAEATSLPDASVDAVVAAQAFHWFDRPRFRAECVRILKPMGFVALMWNVRRVHSSEFTVGYEKLLRDFGTDYLQVRHENVTEEEIAEFFAGPHEHRVFEHVQELDRDGLHARLLSSSYVPNRGDARFEPMMSALDSLFDAHAQDGAVEMSYELRVYAARLV